MLNYFKNHKKKVIILSLIIFIFLSGFLSIYFSYLHRYKGKEIINEWHETDVFNIDDIQVIKKDRDKDFVILNLTDIQLCDIEDLFHRDTIHKELTYLVNTVKPDLITLTGDQTWSNENLMSLKCIIRWLDSYKIPYAPVFGNHDIGNDYNSAVASLNKCCDLYENGKYCLFQRGPSNLGFLGNYVINIEEDDEIIRTLYFIEDGYNDITEEQLKWFSWNAEGIKANNHGEYSKGMVFMHEPVPEYTYALRDYYNGEATAINQVFDYCSTSGVGQSGFFDLAKSKGVEDMVSGHQHTNNFTIIYNDVRLTFALKTGELSFYYDDGINNLNGGTMFTINKINTTITNVMVDRDEFKIEGSDNIYN